MTGHRDSDQRDHAHRDESVEIVVAAVEPVERPLASTVKRGLLGAAVTVALGMAFGVADSDNSGGSGAADDSPAPVTLMTSDGKRFTVIATPDQARALNQYRLVRVTVERTSRRLSNLEAVDPRPSMAGRPPEELLAAMESSLKSGDWYGYAFARLSLPAPTRGSRPGDGDPPGGIPWRLSKQLPGQWARGEDTVSFLEDGRAILDRPAGRFEGTWSIEPDGQLATDALQAFTIPNSYRARVEGTVLLIPLPIGAWRYERLS